MSADFPEARFPCPCELEQGYQKHIAQGRERMRRSQVVICGLARDVADALATLIPRLERLGRMFRDYRIILYENDSHDGTVEMLRAWERDNPRVTLLTERLGTPRWGQVADLARASQLADCRNQYLNYALTQVSGADYVIVSDTDLPSGWSYDGIANTFGHDDWDMVGSYGILYMDYAGRRGYPVFFDTWAFREIGHSEAYSYEEINPRIYQRGCSLVPVWSCFGGLGIYRLKALQSGCRYDGSDCEHVALHAAMRERGFGRLFMNPSQIVVYPPRR